MKQHLYRWSGMAPAVAGIGAALFAATADGATTITMPTNIITSATDVTSLFCTALVWMFWGLVVLSVAMFLVGGYTYATSAGDAEKVGKATRTLTYAAIGAFVALIAAGVPTLVGSFLSAGSFTVC